RSVGGAERSMPAAPAPVRKAMRAAPAASPRQTSPTPRRLIDPSSLRSRPLSQSPSPAEGSPRESAIPAPSVAPLPLALTHPSPPSRSTSASPPPAARTAARDLLDHCPPKTAQPPPPQPLAAP